MSLSSLKVEAAVDTVIARQMTSSIAIATVIAGLMSMALWHSLDQQILYWFMVLSVLSLLRLTVCTPLLGRYHKAAQLPLTFATGLTWGLCAPLFLPALSTHDQLLLILVHIGIVAGSSNSYAGRMMLFYAFMFPILIPLSLWLFFQGDHIYTTIGIIIVLYMAALTIYTKRNTALLTTSVRQNIQLADEVSLRQAHELRLELQQRILHAIARHGGSLADIFKAIVQQLEAHHPDTVVSISMLARDGKHLNVLAAPSLPDGWNKAIDGLAVGPDVISCGTAVFRNERVVVADITTDPLWADYRDAALAFDLKACWSEPVRDANGQMIGTLAIYHHDIHEPCDADIALIEHIASLTSLAIDNYNNRIKLDVARQQQAELIDTIKHSSDMVYVYDLKGLITSANDASKSIFGGEIVGKNINDIIAPHHLGLVRNMIQQKIETGDNTVYEVDVIDASGQQHSLEINSSRIVRDGQVAAFSGIARDITARKKAEEQLSLLMQAIDACHESVIVLNAKGDVEFANPAAAVLYQRPLAQILGHNAALLRGGQVGDDTYQDIIATINQGKMWCGDLQFLRHDGDERLVARRISPIIDESGHVHHQICIDRDMTESTQRSQQLEHTQRLESLGILAGGIAHDFNNLLAVIMGHASIAAHNLAALNDPDIDKNQAHLSSICEASKQAAELCKQMLDYAGKGRFIIEAVNVSNLIRDMARLMKVSIGKHITTRYALNENLPLIEADASQIQQVVLNLITNANEAIGADNGDIVFVTGLMQASQADLAATRTNEKLPAGEYVYIEVSDSGCGMDGATLEKIFDPFFTTKFIGRGLGMSSMMGIVRAHHGAIIVHSQQGEGATFRILLPVSKQMISQQAMLDQGMGGETMGDQSKGNPAKESPAIAESVATSNKKISGLVLVVDDESRIRELACNCLEDIGLSVMQAADGAEAVELYRQHQPEIRLVLLDMTMPKMDGKACFAQLKAINPDVIVLLSSGYSEQQINEMFSAQSPAGFIHKPYMSEALQTQIKQLMV